MSLIEPPRIADLESSGEFDGAWYSQHYPDVDLSGMSPAEHYLLIGRQLGRQGGPHGRTPSMPIAMETGGQPGAIRPPFKSFGIIRHDPLISLLIVSYNSGRDLEALLPTIASQTYRNFEVVLIENGSEDTEPLLKQHFRNYRFERADNVGFAEGNNLALRLAEGELVALINPDTRLDPGTIQALLDALRFDSEAAVAIPKIMFFERFVHVTFRAEAPFAVARDELLAGLPYQKLFVRAGTSVDGDLHSDENGWLAVDLPYTGPRTIACTLKATTEDDLRTVLAQIGYSRQQVTASSPAREVRVELAFNEANCSSARYLVNNAGSALHPDGSPFDRGFGQFDDGAFFSKAYVEAMCGCAALIRRAALVERELFPGPFFAYYEDSELSFWTRSQGYRILYQPEAVIYHRHSESTEENSVLWQVLVGRSRKLYDLATGANTLPLRYFRHEYPEKFQHPLRKKLEALDEKVRSATEMAELVSPPRPTACVYNTYFSSMGGGEKHALDIASLLREKYEVFIASEEDFSIEELEKYFSIDLKGVRKLVSTNIDRHFSSKFDLFVNSTFRSNLSPAARRNLYVVSFPHHDCDEALIDGPLFLHNSGFTAAWAKEYWGDHRNCVVLPIIGQGNLFAKAPTAGQKGRVIVSVGRFTSEGHCKNHHRVIEAFRALVDQDPLYSEWKLKVVGSCNMADEAAVGYLQTLEDLATGYNVELLANASRDVLAETYGEAAIYVHATGLGLPVSVPEKHEHFGITPFEAMAQGCLPVVYAVGGPADQVKAMEQSVTFADFDGLVAALRKAIELVERNEASPKAIWRYAQEIYEKNIEVARSILLEDD